VATPQPVPSTTLDRAWIDSFARTCEHLRLQSARIASDLRATVTHIGDLPLVDMTEPVRDALVREVIQLERLSAELTKLVDSSLA
jgi:hypothetical protein